MIRKRAAVYLRVSTFDQHPETQLHDLRQLAQQRGLEVAGTYEDKISGAKASRPGLDRPMADARWGKFNVVLVWAQVWAVRTPRQAETAWRPAVETWLQRNGLITVSQNPKVLPLFLNKLAHN